ncbi:hypothetical protein [Halococcus agarilyticus]|uniref:hypothetical protein n=1 Tax=Halococcus agarilyticus TaxID=1232219 RepID=UPI000677F486|nr:hypothetical protein [Halococcus agarilyticus]
MTETSETSSIEESGETDRESEGHGTDEAEAPAADGPRAADFETVTAQLADAFDIDGRRGETITDLRTTETDDGRQVVATVEKSRSTMVGHRLDDAKRTGKRVGGGTAILAFLAGVAYAVFAARRLLGSDGDETREDETPPEEISLDE